MFRKAVIVFLALSLMAGMGFATGLVPLEPVKNVRGPVISEIDELDELFELRRYTSAAEYYLGSGDQGDTMLVIFQPLAPCSVYYGEQQWFSAGSYQAFMWEYSDACEENVSDNGRSVPRGTSEESPLGDVLFGPYNNTAAGDQSWEVMFGPDDLPGGGIWRDDNSMFGIGWVKTQDDGLPQPLADDVSARGFTYTWFGGPWNAEEENTWGAYSSDFSGTIVDLMIRAFVSYPEGAPPIIGNMNQLPNTINTDKTCTVMCDILDDNGWTDNDEADLMVEVNGGDATSIPMADDDGDGIFEASFSLTDMSVGVGDQVAYYIEATDDEGGFNSNVDDQLGFMIVELANPNAQVLVVDDGLSDPDVLYTWLEEHPAVSYEWWGVGANKGLDMYTVEGGDWSLVIAAGWGTTTVPTRGYDDNAYANWLGTADHHMLYCDQDYFYTNGEDVAPTFAAGDFAYDFFGMATGNNDPVPTDSAFYGLDGDAISGDFVDMPYAMLPTEFYGSLAGLWSDFCTTAGGGEGFFEGETIGEVGAVRMDGDNKTAAFLFDFFWAVELDSFETDDGWVTYFRGNEQFETLMENLFTWYGIDTGVEEAGDVATPQTYSLSQNYPNPFNPTTQISFSVPTTEMVSLKVFNVEGREVATLFQERAQGAHTVTFDAASLSSGVYFYRLQAGDFTQTNKMMLVK